MLYRPATERLWDTWLVQNEGLWHLFYIRISAGHQGLWNGVSVATSPDLVHFTEVGPLLEKAPDSGWLGTGMVTKVHGQWIMNFSEETTGDPKAQVIRFASSTSLVSGWERIPGVQFEADARWYDAAGSASAESCPRWDSIGVTRVPGRSGGEYVGFFTANARHAKRGASGTVGMAESSDAVHWRALPPPLQPGIFTHCEVVEHCSFGARHYLLLTTNTAAGFRHDPLTCGGSGGTHVVVCDELEGPYSLPPGDSLLHGTRQDDNVFALTVGRPVPDGAGGWLFSHHWASQNHAPSGWWGPVKRLVERAPWQLGLDWWPGNEVLKGTVLASGVQVAEVRPMEQIGSRPVAAWTVQQGQLHVHEDGACAAIDWLVGVSSPGRSEDRSADAMVGRVLECSVRMSSGVALGIWFGTRKLAGLMAGPAPGMGPRASDFRCAIMLNHQHQRLEIFKLMRSLGPGLTVQQSLGHVPWPVVMGVTHHLRILVRGECLEAYIDDRFAHAVVLAEGFDPERLGFVTDRANGVFNPRLFDMDL